MHKGGGGDVVAKPRDPNRDKAFKLWVKSGRQMKPSEIAAKLGVDAARVRKWKSEDSWESKPDPKRGAPRGNKNAKDNKGGGAPVGNVNAFVHGLFSKQILPNNPRLREIFQASDKLSPIDLLWTQIRTLWTQVMYSQEIMHVNGIDDQTKVLKKFKPGEWGDESEWEYQHAWDKQGRAITAQASGMSRVTSMIKQYETMLRTLPADEVNEEQRLRIAKLKAEINSLSGGNSEPVQIIDDIGGGPV